MQKQVCRIASYKKCTFMRLYMIDSALCTSLCSSFVCCWCLLHFDPAFSHVTHVLIQLPFLRHAGSSHPDVLRNGSQATALYVHSRRTV